MKYATYKWNVKIYRNGKSNIPSYYGFRTKAQAEDVANQWRKAGFEAEVIKY